MKKKVTESTLQSGDIVTLILHDHKPIKKLLKTLRTAEISRQQKELAFKIFVPTLVAHAKAEEKSLYLKMKDVTSLRRESFEGETGHELATQLIEEIDQTADDDKWNAKVKVLAELVLHHIIVEEATILKDVQKHMDLSQRRAIGHSYSQIKSELEVLHQPRDMFPHKSHEHRLN